VRAFVRPIAISIVEHKMKLILCSALVASSLGEQITPVQKVLQMMEGMMEKGKTEKQAEQVQFAAYKQFCDGTTSEKQRAIAQATETIEILKSDIEKATADARHLTQDIAEHNDDIGVWEGDKKATTRVRELEKADYDALHTDYEESISALERAISVLKKASSDKKQASLVQLSSLAKLNLIPSEAKKNY